MPGSRLYIVTDPSLAASVQRASKVLSFAPLVPPIIQRVAGFDDRTIRLMKSDMEHGYIQTVQDTVHARLGQGQYLDEVTLKACNEFLRRLENFSDELASGAKPIDFLHFIKNLVAVSTAAFFYGPNNPVEQDPSLADQFWDFDAGIPSLLIGVLPAITAKKAYKGREAVVKALARYLDSSTYQEAADITRERSEIGRRFGVDTENVARSDLTFFFAGIINTSLTSFWMILHIFTRPDLLAQIREELNGCCTERSLEGSRTMSIKRVVKECPVLYAVFREVLRMYSDNFATRVVLSDTLLADKYFLREGSIVQISGGIIHADDRIWGQDVGNFRPERHLVAKSKKSSESNPAPLPEHTGPSGADGKSTSTEGTKQVHPAAFRAFGGGATLCPGRHFAVNEIMGLVAMFVFLFDVSDQEQNQLRVPQKKDNVLPIHVLEPIEPFNVNFERRKAGNGKKTSLTLAF